MTGREKRLNISMVKDQNRKLIFHRIVGSGSSTRGDIARATGLSQGTVKTIMDEFLEAGLIA